MISARAKRIAEHDAALRLAAKFDEMTLSFVSRMRKAELTKFDEVHPEHPKSRERVC
jgi:hypothetical protein